MGNFQFLLVQQYSPAMGKKDNYTHCALLLLIQGIVPIFAVWLSGEFRFLLVQLRW